MSQRTLSLRVRPPRIVVLLGSQVEPAELVRTIRFLSQLWGGRFCQILPVPEAQPDPLTIFRLSQLRPDFIYGHKIAVDEWKGRVYEACQPRIFKTLAPEVAENVRRAQFEEFVTVDGPLIRMFEAKKGSARFARPLKLVNADASFELSAYCAATFGVHHQDLLDEFKDESCAIENDSANEFLDMCQDYVTHNKMSWLDATGYGLVSTKAVFGELSPTVVLVRDLIQDLTLFWNLRMEGSSNRPTWILPLPVEQAKEELMLSSTATWLMSHFQYGASPNYCAVTSSSVAEDECVLYCKLLEEALANTSIEYVDYEPPKNRLPAVIAHEPVISWPAQLIDRAVSFFPPAPKTFSVSSRQSWTVDIINDVSTGKALEGIQLPVIGPIKDILNGPCPPKYDFNAIDRFADGVDSINCRCKTSDKDVRLYLPSPKEILGEILLENGYAIVHDEKQSSYQPTIDRFGSLYTAAAAFTGVKGKILQCFGGKTLLPGEIKGICKLGKGRLKEEGGLVKQLGSHLDERKLRIAEQRFKDYQRGEVPEHPTLSALLEHWVEKSILNRQWKIGPCTHCNQKNYVDSLDIQKSIACPNCGNRILLSDQVSVGYSVDPPVDRALKEGVVPVVLTGRFLQNQTSKGYFWVPGVKYTKNGTAGDIDILACCDGRVVLAECKDLSDTPSGSSTWDDVESQFLELASVAMECKADIAVLAVLAKDVPCRIKQSIDQKLNSKIPHLLLTRSELETGGIGGDVCLQSLMLDEFPEKAIERLGGQRKIEFNGGMTYSIG